MKRVLLEDPVMYDVSSMFYDTVYNTCFCLRVASVQFLQPDPAWLYQCVHSPYKSSTTCSFSHSFSCLASRLMEKQRNSSQDLVERVHVMRKFFTNTNCETCGCLLYNIFWTSKEGNVKVKMSFSKVPMKNPGRYFETFVKIVEPIGGQAQNTAFCSQRLVYKLKYF